MLCLYRRDLVGGVDAIWDRGSLVALDKADRKKWVILNNFVGKSFLGDLLVTMFRPFSGEVQFLFFIRVDIILAQLL